jgi:hypothetical protein
VGGGGWWCGGVGANFHMVEVQKQVRVRIGVVPYDMLVVKIEMFVESEVVRDRFEKIMELRFGIDGGHVVFKDEDGRELGRVEVTQFADYVDSFIRRKVAEFEEEVKGLLALFGELNKLKVEKGYNVVVLE